MVRNSSSKRGKNIAQFLEEDVRDPGKKAAKFILDPIPKKAKPAPGRGKRTPVKPLPPLRGDQITKASKDRKTHVGFKQSATNTYRKRAQDIRAGRAAASYNSASTKPKAQKSYKAAKTRGLSGPN